MTDARGELYEVLGAAMLAAGLHPNEAQTLAITDAIRAAPVPSDDARGELLAQAIHAADGIDLLQDSRSLRRRTAEILRELVEALRPAPVPQCEAEPVAVSDEDWQRALDCAMSCLRPPFHISRSTMDNAMQHAFGMLSLVATPPSRSDAEAEFYDPQRHFVRPPRPPPSEAGREAMREALLAAKEFADDEFSDASDLPRKHRISVLCDKIDAALSPDPGTVAVTSTLREAP